ncbi:MAG: hypothetical protein ACI845_001481 [Gammaproteobacteria bacterium]|jgi:hypothetical protein
MPVCFLNRQGNRQMSLLHHMRFLNWHNDNSITTGGNGLGIALYLL